MSTRLTWFSAGWAGATLTRWIADGEVAKALMLTAASLIIGGTIGYIRYLIEESRRTGTEWADIASDLDP
jgi:hypothetical protein